MKLIKGRAMTYFALAVVLLSFIGLIVLTVMSSGKEKYYDSYKVHINGKYSVDGGEWKDTIPEEMVHTRFHTLTIKGTLSRPIYFDESCLVIMSNNIWYRIQTDPGLDYSNYREEDNGPLKDTPGEDIMFFQGLFIFDDLLDNTEEISVTMTFPYTMFSNADLSDCFNMYITDATGVYELMLEQNLPSIILCLMICFFGLFAFPIAGSVIGGINIRYWAFSVLCFFTGFHLLTQVIAPYLPLWLDSPVACLAIKETTSHLFGICVLVFIKAILRDPKHKIIGNAALFSFSALLIALYVFHFTGFCDLFASNPYAQGFFTVCALILTVCLFREMKSNRDAKLAIVTIIPLGVTLLFDTLNLYIGFSDLMLFEVGATITLLIQIVTLLYDLRQQYKETIRYQQMQRELVESRVAIMVSQIQPHFLYNSLSSIAMMCTIDPETAQEATVTFADYLRGNMDSLKQKTPVPFSKELEHLKKYLYIEKLRFGKKLNIVYDIQTEDFVLPQLSIQPLAENAVKHGISKKRGGGTLIISTRETDDSYEVIVSDDGKGFDVNEVKDDGRSHVGMDNVRRRLKEMCGGEVIINSTIGEGTVATVILPKEGQIFEDTMR